MKYLIAFVGKAGSGKDTLVQYLCNKHPEWNKIIPYTTRPRREGEIDGLNYHYVTLDKFNFDEMLYYKSFNNWFYGIANSDIQEGINIGIFDPKTYATLLQKKDIKLIGFHVLCNDKTRLLRQLNREKKPDVHEIIRRFQADENDFSLIDYPLKPLWNDILIDRVAAAADDYIQHIVGHL